MSQQLSALMAFEGRALLPDRQSLVRSVAGPHGVKAAAAIRAFLAAADEVLALFSEIAPRSSDPLVGLSDRVVSSCLAATGTSGGPTLTDAARLALLVADAVVRDHVIRRAFRVTGEPWVPMLMAAARMLPDREAVELCAILAIVAYGNGDGALAQVAADRVRAVSPRHSLTVLLLRAIDQGMEPSQFARLAEADARFDRDRVSPGKAERPRPRT